MNATSRSSICAASGLIVLLSKSNKTSSRMMVRSTFGASGGGTGGGGGAGFGGVEKLALRSPLVFWPGHKKSLWLPFEKNIGRHTVSDVGVTLKVVEVTATRQRE